MRVEVFLCYIFYISRHVLASYGTISDKPYTGINEKIGNFSIELFHHTAKIQTGRNLIISPITIWTAMAVLAEGASGNTLQEINRALRLTANKTVTRSQFRSIAQALQVKTNSVELAKFNGIIVDEQRLPLRDFLDIAKNHYQAETITLKFMDIEKSANVVNKAISDLTHGKIPKIVDSDTFRDSHLLLTSGLYFKGQWRFPFDPKSTSKQPFFDSNGQQIGEVNMMYNCETYPFSNIKELQARVIELPYGNEDRLSMVIMLPHQGVSLETMFANFQYVPFSRVFDELRVSKEYFSGSEVDCNIPRFKIEANIDMTEVLKTRMGIHSLFDESKARLPLMARSPLYVSKVFHKAVIEVGEEGTTAAGVSVVDIPNRAGAILFEANRPFFYMIVDNDIDSIIFGGFYFQPSL